MIESWKQSALVAVVLIGVIALGGGLQSWSLEHGPTAPPLAPATTATPVATQTPGPSTAITPEARIVDCPVDREICDFAIQAESWLRTGDARPLVAPGTPWDDPNGIAQLSERIAATLAVVARLPRLASIGCPLGAGAGDCSTEFSLTFATLLPTERSKPGDFGGALTLGFERRPGLQPALANFAVPLGDDRVMAAASGGKAGNCSFSPRSAVTDPHCIGAQFMLVHIERPTSAGQPPECPVIPAICAEALKVEQQLGNADYAVVAGGTVAGAKLAAELRAALGDGHPRLIAIGCPHGDTMVFCNGPFSFAFTTLDPAADWTVGGKLVVLRFEGPAESARFVDVLTLDDADTREAAILGGIATKPCNIAGAAPDRPQPCNAAYFERYWSSEPFVVAGPPVAVKLQSKPPASPPANGVLYTAKGPCWGCDSPDESMQKHVVDAAGRMTTTTILENGKGILDGWTIGYLTAVPDGSVLAAVVCDAGYCGGMGGEKPEATWRVVWSKDGGATWTEAFRVRTEYAFIGNITRNGFTVRTYRAQPTGAIQTAYAVTGTGVRQLQAPSGLLPRPDVALLADGSVAWIPLSEDSLVIGGLRAEDGTRLALGLPAGAQQPELGTFPDGREWAAWYQGGYRIGVFKATGELEAVYDLGSVMFAGLASPALGVATVSAPGVNGGLPAMLDITERTVTPIGAPFGEPPLTGRSRLLAIEPRR